MYHLRRTLKEISVFLILVFGCRFPKNQSAGSYFAMFLCAGFYCISSIKPGFHMIVTVGDASPRQAREHIGDGCVKREHFLNDVADQTGTVRGRIKRVQMSLKRGFHMIIAVIVSICRRHVAEASPTVTIIWKPGFNQRGERKL